MCVFSDEEAAKLSSVVVSAEVISSASLPLQWNLSMSSGSYVSSHKTTMNKKHKNRRPLDYDTVEPAISSELCDDSIGGKCHEVRHKGSKSRRDKTKHMGRAGESDVSKSVSNKLCDLVDSIDDVCREVDKQGRVGKCHRKKHKRTEAAEN